MANITKRQHKDGAWAYTFKVYRGRDSKTGKQLTPYTSTWVAPLTWSEKKADKEAEKQSVIFEQQCTEGDISVNKQNFADYAEYVIKLKEAKGIKHKTIQTYKASLVRLTPLVGYYKIKDITVAVLNKMTVKLLAMPQKRDPSKKLSAKTVLEDFRFVSTVLSQAVKEKIIRDNPAMNADKPVVRKKTPVYYQESDVVAIAEALEEAPLKWKLFTHLLLISGARRGEICGLSWSDIDYEARTIAISKALLYTPEKGVYIETTKEDNPHFVKLPIETMQLIRQYEAWYKQQKLLCGDRWHDTDFVFVQEDGKAMHPDSITGWLSKFAKAHPDLPHLNPHAFRHTHASLLYFANVDIVTISNRLGHKQVSTTQNVYAHIIQKADEIASECAADIILQRSRNEKEKTKSS